MDEAINIGPREQRKRWTLGVVALGIAITLALLLYATHAPRWSKLVVFGPAFVAGLGLFQARAKT